MTEKDVKWSRKLAPFTGAENRRGAFETVLTLVLLAAFWLTAYAASQWSWWLAMPFAFVAGLMLVRVFVIQHDCGHGALFSTAKLNDRVGRMLGVLTLTPYAYWRHNHNLHHASSGNLDKRGIGDIETLTVEEYRSRGFWGRLAYRAYRSPLVLFAIGPAFVFLIKQRLPFGHMDRPGAWVSVLGTNAGIAALAVFIILVFGWKTLVFIHLPASLVGASIGVWLFYIQHQFASTFWEHAPAWERETAALEGSSFYDLPKPLMWVTGNIGIHHVHHLAARIPFWRLPQVLAAFPKFRETGRLNLRESLYCVKLTLWDERSSRLISFADFRNLRPA